ncbi:alpha/beta fold hydrolase [Planctomycetaceae bacterium SH139]
MDEIFLPLGTRQLCLARSSRQAPPVLMLHGVTRRWQSFLPLWSSLAMRWGLGALDFRGHGQSDNVSGGYHVCNYVEDVIAVLDAEYENPVVLYGHSLGAMTAAATAAQLGDRVSALVLEDPPFHTMGERISQSSLLGFFQAMQELAGDPRSASCLAALLADTHLRDPRTGATTRLGDTRDAVSLRFTASCLKKLDPVVLSAIVAGEWLNGYDTESICRKITCPVLVLQADPQTGGMLTDQDANEVDGWLADSVRVKFNGSGHLIHWAQTDKLLNCVHGFLESVQMR